MLPTCGEQRVHSILCDHTQCGVTTRCGVVPTKWQYEATCNMKRVCRAHGIFVCVMCEYTRWCALSMLCRRCGPCGVTLTSVVLYDLNVN